MGQADIGGFRSWSFTHAGTRRSANEDALVDRPEIGLWAVADGAGESSCRGKPASLPFTRTGQ